MGTTTLERTAVVDTSLMGIVTDKLGTSSTDYTDVEVGKGVKLAADAYVPVVKADEIEGIVSTVEHGTVNSGFSWGGVQTKGRAEAVVGASQTSNIAVGGFVCADTPIAPATEGLVRVFDAGTGYAAPSTFLWRVIRIVTGTGASGDTVLIERA